MEAYKAEFIDFMVESNVLKFGEFTLKSGRKSPFFMNAGAYVTGSQLKKLGEYYAKAIHDKYGDDFDVLFGPAYKGIPISVVTAIAYSELYGKEVRYCSDRKEEKDHGADKGSFLGSKLQDGDRVVMIEDVTTSGKSMEETVPKVRGAADVEIVGLMVSLNRMEVGKGGEKSALEEVKDTYGFDTNAIVPCSAKSRNQRWVNIDNSIWIGFYHHFRNYHQTAGQHNQIHMIRLYSLQKCPIEKFSGFVAFRRYALRRNPVFFGSLQSISICVVTDYHRHLCIGNLSAVYGV